MCDPPRMALRTEGIVIAELALTETDLEEAFLRIMANARTGVAS